jgi:formate C-acetyltransferase
MATILSTAAPLNGTFCLDLDPQSRCARLRDAYWQRRHYQALAIRPLKGGGDGSLVGHARDFAMVLAASEPQIQPDELIVGSVLAIPEDYHLLDLGYYNTHYPPGHELILRLGLRGVRDQARQRLTAETDPARYAFLEAVAIAYDAAIAYVAHYVDKARELAVAEPNPQRQRELAHIAAVCQELATGRPTTLQAAMQLVQFTRLFGGRGDVGRLDQWLFPYYQQDRERGLLTEQSAQELIACLFVKLNEFASRDETRVESALRHTTPWPYSNDNLRNITLAGQTPAGADGCNELTLLCLAAAGRLMLPEPKVNVRLHDGSPPELLRLCCRVLAKGANVLALFNDQVAVPALQRLGIPLEDALDYCNDGCSELILGGKSTLYFHVYNSLPLLNELVLSRADEPFETFDELLAAFQQLLIDRLYDGAWDTDEITHPYFAASIADCLTQASPGAARYHLHGAILAQVANSADGLAAIRQLVYEEPTVPWATLVAALRADWEGYEPLRQRILHRTPHYGNDQGEADELVKAIAEGYCEAVQSRADNQPGPGTKVAAGLMDFGIGEKRDTLASPDGRRRGDPTANSFSPAVGMDRSGPTAVLKSVAKVDLTKATHGSVLDIALHSSAVHDEADQAKLEALIRAFVALRCTATLQLNVIDRARLLQARANPRAPEFRTLIVRVWGFSAVFVDLTDALQEHVLARTEHTSWG